MKKGCAVGATVAVIVVVAAIVFFNVQYDRMNRNALARINLQREVWGVLFAPDRDRGQPPTELADLKPYAEEFPRGYRELLDGKWNVRWGVPLDPNPGSRRNSGRVLAYQSLPGYDYGWVIYGDGALS